MSDILNSTISILPQEIIWILNKGAVGMIDMWTRTIATSIVKISFIQLVVKIMSRSGFAQTHIRIRPTVFMYAHSKEVHAVLGPLLTFTKLKMTELLKLKVS